MATELQATSAPARVARIAIPVAVAAAVVAVRPEIATGTFSSATSVAKVLALVAVWMGFSWLVRRFVANAVARTAIIATAGAGLLAVTVLPYFQDETVNDAFPAAAAPAVTDTTVATAPSPAAQAGEAPATTVAAVVATNTVATTVPAGPQRLAAGEFRGLAGHRGSGDVVLYRQPDGSLLVRLEGFDVSSVPAPVVYLVPGANQQRPGGVNLGTLRGNQGNLNIAIPAGTDVSGAQTLLIWCEAFSVPVAGATTT